MRHIISEEGRSLIRTYLASATKNAAISSRAMSKLRGKTSKGPRHRREPSTFVLDRFCNIGDIWNIRIKADVSTYMSVHLLLCYHALYVFRGQQLFFIHIFESGDRKDGLVHS